jgi:hypothetical protein
LIGRSRSSWRHRPPPDSGDATRRVASPARALAERTLGARRPSPIRDRVDTRPTSDRTRIHAPSVRPGVQCRWPLTRETQAQLRRCLEAARCVALPHAARHLLYRCRRPLQLEIAVSTGVSNDQPADVYRESRFSIHGGQAICRKETPVIPRIPPDLNTGLRT